MDQFINWIKYRFTECGPAKSNGSPALPQALEELPESLKRSEEFIGIQRYNFRQAGDGILIGNC
jgi:hypothetical protein